MACQHPVTRCEVQRLIDEVKSDLARHHIYEAFRLLRPEWINVHGPGPRPLPQEVRPFTRKDVEHMRAAYEGIELEELGTILRETPEQELKNRFRDNISRFTRKLKALRAA